jgi:hypothetical protein
VTEHLVLVMVAVVPKLIGVCRCDYCGSTRVRMGRFEVAAGITDCNHCEIGARAPLENGFGNQEG